MRTAWASLAVFALFGCARYGPMEPHRPDSDDERAAVKVAEEYLAAVEARDAAAACRLLVSDARREHRCDGEPRFPPFVDTATKPGFTVQESSRSSISLSLTLRKRHAGSVLSFYLQSDGDRWRLAEVSLAGFA